jgi:hypothetical protein
VRKAFCVSGNFGFIVSPVAPSGNAHPSNLKGNPSCIIHLIAANLSGNLPLLWQVRV